MSLIVPDPTKPAAPVAPITELPGAAPPMDPSQLKRQELMALIAQAQLLGVDFSSISSAKYLLSICPWPLTFGPISHGGEYRLYSVPGIPKGSSPGYFVLPVFNTFTTILDTSRSEEEIRSNGGIIPMVQRTVSAQQFLTDLIQAWAGDHPANSGGGSLGIMQIASKIPTAAELKLAHTRQNLFFQTLVNQASKFFSTGKATAILPEHYRAAEYLGLTSKTHPWVIVSAETQTSKITCPQCGFVEMPSDAYRCPNCRENIAEYFFSHDLPVDKVAMPAVAKEVEFLLSRRGKK